jgi:hypothetical protein
MDGYMENARGHQVPLDQVKELDHARHDLVMDTVAYWLVLQAQIAKFKVDTLADIAAFVQLAAEQYGANVGGHKGNVTLMSYDGKYKLVRSIAEHLQFDERLQAARALLGECLKDWTKDSPVQLQALVDDAFQVDGDGRVNTGRILGLRRLKIDDERWHRAMEAIGDSLQVVGSKSYIRLYERMDDGGYVAVPLDMAKV